MTPYPAAEAAYLLHLEVVGLCPPGMRRALLHLSCGCVYRNVFRGGGDPFPAVGDRLPCHNHHPDEEPTR